ncbi:hypothetical protein [Plantactinospora sonchi]|uniref:Uncharacterized protein n=1 Tax=Plantactinospora sonchi TaxID=1544735 RepID=A0ABU7RYX2_9ACTN
MTATVPDGPPVMLCRECDGMTFTLVACRCTYYGNTLLVSDEDRAPGEPYHNCLECDGVGTVGRPCHDCRQTGRRRAQLVLTVANLDTGAVASANVVPGVVEPARGPDADPGWYLRLAPLLRDLAARVGATSWTDVNGAGSPDGPLVMLPKQWRPELPASDRKVLEADAIARCSHDPWRLYLGRTTSEPPRDPAAELARLCRLADLLCLDLVIEARRVEARRVEARTVGARTVGARRVDGRPVDAGQVWTVDDLTWHLRYEVSGGPVPTEARCRAENLTTAITGTSDLDAFYGLEERGRTAPAHHLTIGYRPPAEPPDIDLDQLERRILADCVDVSTGTPTFGAQAIWRDDRWWHTSLQVADTTETLSESSTGQIHQRRGIVLRRGWQPPAPSWQGEAISYLECPDCDPTSRLRRCYCRIGTGVAAPDCPRCAGAGRAPSPLRCDTCRGSRRLYQDVTITLTDLTSRVVHLSWRVDAAGWLTSELSWQVDDSRQPVGEQTWRLGDRVPAPHVGTHPGGKPLHQLPARFRLGERARDFGVRPDDLTELDGGGDLDHNLRYGTVTLHRVGDDPLTEYVRSAARGRPGARLFVLARRPDVPPLADLIRLALGLRLAVTVTIVDHVRNAGDLRLIQDECWDVSVGARGGTVVPADPPARSTPEAATAFCLDYLELVIAGAVPDDPIAPIPVLQCPTPTVVDDPVPLLRRLARHHAGQPVAAHYTGDTCQLLLRERDSVRPLATAPTLPAAVTVLGLLSGHGDSDE